MFNLIKQFFDLWFAYPIVALFVTIGLAIFLFRYRKQIRGIIDKKMGIKSGKALEFYSMRSGEFFDFGEVQIIADYNLFHGSLCKKVKKLRKKNKFIKINLSKVQKYNHNFVEAIRDVVRDMIIYNNIRCKVVFPLNGMNDLYDELDKFIKVKNSYSVELQKVKGECE